MSPKRTMRCRIAAGCSRRALVAHMDHVRARADRLVSSAQSFQVGKVALLSRVVMQCYVARIGHMTVTVASEESWL